MRGDSRITTAVADAAYAELPLTRRREARPWIGTGHTEQVAAPETEILVQYLPAARLAVIAEQLLARGWRPATPVTLIRNASRPDQSVTTLMLSGATRHDSPAPPLVAVIGPVGENRWRWCRWSRCAPRCTGVATAPRCASRYASKDR